MMKTVLKIHPLTCWFGLLLIAVAHGHWSQHYRYKNGASRNKRQFNAAGGSASGPAQIDLNITVPFIFSARLYPYGESKGDKLMDPNLNTQAYILKNDLNYQEENYTAIYISRDGFVGFGPGLDSIKRDSFPKGPKLIAVYWTQVSLGDTGRIYFRETEDDNVLQLAGSEVQIQYRYSQEFRPKSVFIITWENIAPPHASKDLPNSQRNLYQLALIMSKNGTFAHMIYSKLKWHDSAYAGFNYGNGRNFINLPASGTPNVVSLANNSDIGIPGEWLFKVDGRTLFLCGPGFKGAECVNRCERGEFFYDCSRHCHCAKNETCNVVTGVCPQPECSKGWDGPPTCETDVDECALNDPKILCNSSMPDCINTQGSFVCSCLTGYDSFSKLCHGSLLGSNQFGAVRNTPSVNGGISLDGRNPAPIVPNLLAPPNRNPPNTAFIPFEPHKISDLFGANVSKTSTNRASLLNNNTVEIHPQQPQIVLTSNNRSISNNNVGPIQSTAAAIPPIPVSRTPNVFVQQTVPGVVPTISSTIGNPLCNTPCAPNAHCEIVQDFPKCTCNVGWTGDGNFCVDVNECFMDHACEGNARCQNTPGSYLCLCEEGFQISGHQCIDIDECAEGVAHCPALNSSTCVNTHGSYECRCKVGFNGNPSNSLGCIDINECLIPEFYCGGFADCENSLGGFRCHCHQGYQRNGEGNGCEDIDECKATACNKAATCRNTPGSFQCTCIDGYAGNGLDCDETLLYPFSRSADQKLPQQSNANMEIPLVKPMKFLGKNVNRVYVNANGIVTFDRPLESFKDKNLKDTNLFGVATLYDNVDLAKNGAVYVKETSEYSFLTRASLNVQESFHDPSFRANSVLIITNDDVVAFNETDVTKTNRFQTIFAAGDQGTYVTLIYERVASGKAQAAILTSDSKSNTILPWSGVNSTALKETSNIGVPGKWIFKIDDKNVMLCPYGLLDSPFCTKDVDECADGHQKCHAKAACTNTFGSYHCTCQPGWTGDGFSCFELTMCFMATSTVCGVNAGCFVPSNGSTPYCVCNRGYYGDGQTCFKEVFTPSLVRPTEGLPVESTLDVGLTDGFTATADTTDSTDPTLTPETSTFSQPDAITASSTNAAVRPTSPIFVQLPVDNTITEEPSVHETKVEMHHDVHKPHESSTVSNEIDDEGVSNKFDANRQNKKTTTDPTSSTNMLVIIIPAVLCGVWFILIVGLLVVCLRKRKQKQRDKYGLNYYLPSTGSNKGSTITNYAAYGSPQYYAPARPTYDYYNNTYYPDPYNPYKY